jgi:hypothetical protein
VLPAPLCAIAAAAVRVRIRSRSSSARPPSTATVKRPVLVPVSAHGFGQGSELRLGVHDALDDVEQIEGAAGEAVDARHRPDVGGGQLASIRLSSRRSARAPVTLSR